MTAKKFMSKFEDVIYYGYKEHDDALGNIIISNV